jgi:hypothetical protein
MPVFYHGTTRSRAAKIRRNGFEPRAPSRRVWFARNRGVADRRSRHKASGSDRPVVLTCEIDIGQLARWVGGNRVFHTRGILSVRGSVPASVLRDGPADHRRATWYLDLPEGPAPLADWINRLLELKPHKGVSRKHAGVQRLARWIQNRTAQNPDGEVSEAELAQLAQAWLPEFFDGVAIDPQRLRSLRYRGSATGDASVLVPHEPVDEPDDDDDPVEAEALAGLASDKPKRRIRGLQLLTEVEAAEDLVEWCLLLVDDDDTDVAVAALETMAIHGEGVNPFLVEDLAAAEDRRLRAAALEVLALHDVEGAGRWLWEGVCDPEPHVRMRLVRHLGRIDPNEHPDIFETALTDPNPEVVKLARRRSEHRGIGRPSW